MTTQTTVVDQQAQEQQNNPVFNIQRVYVKGMSLEMPHAPEIFVGPQDINMNVNVAPTLAEIAPGLFQVVLRATLEATERTSGKVWFVLEIDQAGIFELRNIPEEHVSPLLNIRCPGILLNYLRVQITDTLSRATLPAFMLPEFDWAQIAQNQAAAQQQAALEETRVVH